MRGDSGFCRPKVLRRLDAWGIDYIIGVQKNPTLEWLASIAQVPAARAGTTVVVLVMRTSGSSFKFNYFR